MVAIIVVLTIVAFITVDYFIRMRMEQAREARLRKERAAALETGLRLDFAGEARTLKRVEVKDPRARILAVDDEEVILDSFRKVLVLDGFSNDTVQSGPEALTLVQKNDYDFVFTDLKMPDMDGVEVVKAVKHLRPDIDVIVITGYATIETAVETMKFGAMDYVQKPFTADELTEFVKKCLIRREDRLERTLKPRAALVTASTGPASEREFAIWGGVFVSEGHSWVSVEPSGAARVGLDDFAQKVLGVIDGVELPQEGQEIKKGQKLFSVRANGKNVTIPSPFNGRVDAVNKGLKDAPQLINRKPYEAGWVCRVVPSKLSEELREMRIGSEALGWYKEEIDRYFAAVKQQGGEADASNIAATFLRLTA